jgi:hypothetical protein
MMHSPQNLGTPDKKKFNCQDAKNAKFFLLKNQSFLAPWRLGGSKSYSFC